MKQILSCFKHLKPRLTRFSSSYASEYRESIENPESFWRSKMDLIEWFKKPEHILVRNPPFDRWYSNGLVNASYNCLDVHVESGFSNQSAIIHDSPLTNKTEKITYKELLDEVSLFAGVLAKHGIKKGDRILIYMPMIPQAIVAMLASARIGAVHSLVFGGFASKELATRINHAEPKIIVSANTGVEPGRLINYKSLLDNAIELSSHKPHRCIFYNRKMFPEVDSNKHKSLYLDYSNEISSVKPHVPIPIDSNDPLYILYTSGTTGKPKGVVRPTAGYLIALKYAMQAIYGLKPGETFWAASDLGWVVGHSFICYGPLLARNTTVLYEGKPIGTPDAGAIFRVISEHKVASMFIAPTALRAIHQTDPKASLGRKYPIDNLKHMFVAGEHCEHETLNWIKEVIGGRPIFDHWWQTESGWPMSSKLSGLMTKSELESGPAGNSGKPVPGWNIKVLRDDNTEAGPNELGRIVVKLPLPPGSLGYPGYYDTADVGTKCEDGCITVLSRADDVINIAGHRLSSSAIEEAILDVDDCVECAVVEAKDTIKGAVPFAFIVRLKNSQMDESELIKKVVEQVRKSIGPVASFKRAVIVDRLPKTRSGKIARNTLKAMINKQEYSIPVTIEDANVYKEIDSVLKKKKII